jgi:hypothetical protein
VGENRSIAVRDLAHGLRRRTSRRRGRVYLVLLPLLSALLVPRLASAGAGYVRLTLSYSQPLPDGRGDSYFSWHERGYAASAAIGYEIGLFAANALGFELRGAYSSPAAWTYLRTLNRQSSSEILAGVRYRLELRGISIWVSLHAGHGRLWSSGKFRAVVNQSLLEENWNADQDAFTMSSAIGFDWMFTRHVGLSAQVLGVNHLFGIDAGSGHTTGTSLDFGGGLVFRL